jgi:RNA polymerase sigma-70 factor (ECF subfamily)
MTGLSTLDAEHRRHWFRSEILPLESQLLRCARRYCRASPDEAQDLVHEAFAKIIAYEGWVNVANPSGFAFRVLSNIARDALRRRKVVSIEAGGDLERFHLVDDQPDPEMCAVYSDELRNLHALIASMPTQMRRVFTLRKVYGLSQNDIAVRLGLTVSTVEKHVVRGLRFCSERMDRSASRSRRMAQSPKWNIAADRNES